MRTIRWPGLRGVGVADLVLTAAVGAFVGFGSAKAAENQLHDVPRPHVLDGGAYALIAVAVLALLARRLWPRAVLAVTVAAVFAYLALRYPYGPLMFVPILAAFTAGLYVPVRRSLPAVCVGVALVAGQQLLAVHRGHALIEVSGALAAWTGWLLVPWAAGTVTRYRRESAAQAAETEARRRAYEERLRIAREVHDVVGHGLAVISMQAGIALHVLDRRPEQAQVALEAIRQASKDAMDELRTTLAVFRRPDRDPAAGGGADVPDRHPEPGLAELDALVSASSASGLPVRLVVEGEAGHVPAAVEGAAYRIVQESLTNALRHAGPATARIRLVHAPGVLDVEVIDTGSARPADRPVRAGHGIVGMRERAAGVGGTLLAEPRPDGGFRVHARLPYGGPAQ